MIIVTSTRTYTSTIASGIPNPSPNSTYSILCDGLPRFGSNGEAANATVILPTPITSGRTYKSLDYIWPTGKKLSSCPIMLHSECR